MHRLRGAAIIGVSGIRPNFLGIGVNLDLHAEFSFGLEFSMTGKANTLIKMENVMTNLNTACSHCFESACNFGFTILGILRNAIRLLLEHVVGLSIWCGVVLLRSQVGKTPTRIEKRLVVRGRLCQEKLGRFESFPPHQFASTANNSFKPRPLRGSAAW